MGRVARGHRRPRSTPAQPHKVSEDGCASLAGERAPSPAAPRAEPCAPPERGHSSLQACTFPSPSRVQGPPRSSSLSRGWHPKSCSLLIISRQGDVKRAMSPGGNRWGRAAPARGARWETAPLDPEVGPPRGWERARAPAGRRLRPSPPGGAAPRSAVPARVPGRPAPQQTPRHSGSTARVSWWLGRGPHGVLG